ncbi:MAG TPA: hypothetical protein VGK92_11640 [Gaiellales bacterium]
MRIPSSNAYPPQPAPPRMPELPTAATPDGGCGSGMTRPAHAPLATGPGRA